MECVGVSQTIIEWLKEKIKHSQQKGFVVGVSGGIDSALVSTLCAHTGFSTICVTMPILQSSDQHDRAHEHLRWLEHQFKQVKTYEIDLSQVFVDFKNTLPEEAKGELALANMRSRLRMTTLYTLANTHDYLVTGTGNKIEDFGIGFFTKYGDGGVDISPIGDLVKSEVFLLAEHLGILELLRNAEPTDGLWGDERTDEAQIGASYDELETAMQWVKKHKIEKMSDIDRLMELSTREREVLNIYINRHLVNRHKQPTLIT